MFKNHLPKKCDIDVYSGAEVLWEYPLDNVVTAKVFKTSGRRPKFSLMARKWYEKNHWYEDRNRPFSLVKVEWRLLSIVPAQDYLQRLGEFLTELYHDAEIRQQPIRRRFLPGVQIRGAWGFTDGDHNLMEGKEPPILEYPHITSFDFLYLQHPLLDLELTCREKVSRERGTSHVVPHQMSIATHLTMPKQLADFVYNTMERRVSLDVITAVLTEMYTKPFSSQETKAYQPSPPG